MEWRNLPPIRNRIERRLVFSPPFEGGVGGVLVTSINPTLIPAVILTCTLTCPASDTLVRPLRGELRRAARRPGQVQSLDTSHGRVGDRLSLSPMVKGIMGSPSIETPLSARRVWGVSVAIFSSRANPPIRFSVSINNRQHRRHHSTQHARLPCLSAPAKEAAVVAWWRCAVQD